MRDMAMVMDHSLVEKKNPLFLRQRTILDLDAPAEQLSRHLSAELIRPLNHHCAPSAPFNTRRHLTDSNFVGVALNENSVARIENLGATRQGEHQPRRGRVIVHSG